MAVYVDADHPDKQEQVTEFFDGLELIEPGVVQLNRWRPDPGDAGPGAEISSWAGLGRS